MDLLYIAVFISFTTVFIFAYGVMYNLNYDKILIEDRVGQIKELQNKNRSSVENPLFSKRIFWHFYNSFCSFILKATPEQKLATLNKKLERAGLLKNGTVQKWLYNKYMIMLIAAALFGLVSYYFQPNIWESIMFAVIVLLLINVCMNFYLSRRFEMRKKKILKDLPYTLDLITVSVEAGASFDGAMARVISNINGELCDEFAKCLKEIRMGIQRRVALKNMSERCDVKELTTLINSLIQADELGVGLGRVLRIEASNLRDQRRQIAREKAMKAPVKMLFPLIFFIFPAIFIIILGPAIIKIFNAFIKG